MSLPITNEHVEIVGLIRSPVELPVIISPRQIEGNPIEETCAEPIDMSADKNNKRL